MFMKVCYFGSYDREYTRNRNLLKGLPLNGVELLECNDRSPKFKKYFGLFKQYQKIRKQGYDIMFVAFQGQMVIWLAWLLARWDKKPIVYDAIFSLYDSSVLDKKVVTKNSLKGRFLHFLDWYSCRLADITIVHTRFHKEFFLEEFNLKSREHKFRMLYVGADDTQLFPRAELNPKGDPFIVHFHGSYIPAQGLEHVIIGAAKILKDKKENVIFNLIGDGQAYPEVRRLAKEWNLTNVNFIGRMSYRELGDYMNRSDVCLGSFGHSPKITRVVPLKVFESLACARALITADTPAVREILVDHENALLTELGSPEMLADKILELKNNPELKEKIAKNGYETFKNNLDATSLAAKLKGYFQELL